MGTQLLGAAAAVPERHCGRCQCAFPADPTLFVQSDWALCPECTAILLPGRPSAPTRHWPSDVNPPAVTEATLRQ